MKYLIRIFALSLMFNSCSGGQEDPNQIPEDLAGKKEFLRTKKEELRALTRMVNKLESDIQAEDPTFGERSKTPVTTASVNRKDFKHFVEIQGAVEADDMVDVTSEAMGRIIALNAKEGQSIKKGQLVAKLDMESIHKQIAELETAKELATTVYERQSRLWKQNIGSELQYLEAKNALARLEKSMETLQFQLTKADVYAPVSGVVERVVLQSGELASPGMPIVQILNTNKLKVVANVPENHLRSVNRGEKVAIQFPALDMEQDARVSLIGRMIDPSNRTFTVEANISNKGGVVKPNLLAIMLINDYSEDNVVTIPLELVQQEVGGKNYVFITEDGANGTMARKVYVETGDSYNNEIVISSGLKGGEQIIVDGARDMSDDELIEVSNSKIEANNG